MSKFCLFHLVLWPFLMGCAQSTQSLGDLSVQVTHHESEDFYYELRLEFPHFSCSDGVENCGASQLNESVLEVINAHWIDFKGEELLSKKHFVEQNVPALAEGDAEGARKFSLEVNYELFESGPYVSLLFQINRYDLGAHANLMYESLVFDRFERRFLSITDVIHDFQDNRETLNAVLTDKLSQQDSCFDRNVSLTSRFENFSLGPEAVMFHFAPYELGAYVCGPVTLEAGKAELEMLGLWGLH